MIEEWNAFCHRSAGDHWGIGLNKEAYLNELARYLKLLPPEECAELMGEFKEHFEFARLSGRSEAEIISKLGHPRLIARELLTQSQIEKKRINPQRS
ncbi:DUF1700 domain-containing protein [Paenibacillus rhizoplanae]